jgi:hypothetical protein
VRAESAALAADAGERLAGILAFLAAALHRLDRPDEAAAALARLRAHLGKLEGALPRSLEGVVREAEALVAASRPATRKG